MRDNKPRKRRNDGIIGRAQEAIAKPIKKRGRPRKNPVANNPTPQTPQAKKPRVVSPPATMVDEFPLPPPPGGDDQASLPLGDIERKLRADADWKEAQARKLELDLAEREGRLISREVRDADLAARVLVLRKSLLVLPKRLRDEFALESDARRIDLRLTHELEALIRQYAGEVDQAALSEATA